MGRALVKLKRDSLLLPYQAGWVNDPARLKIMEKGRQIGLSYASAYGLTRRKSIQTAKLDAWISSRDDIQARLFLEDCRSFADILQTGAIALGERAIDDHGHSAYVLQFANGLRLHSMSSNPDAQAGKRGDRLLDEFALHPDPRRLYAIAYPGITWGGQLEIISTHRGSANFFNELIQQIKHKGNPKNFSLHTVTLQNALDQGFLVKLQAKLPPDDERQEMTEADYFDFIRRGCPDEETFQQEYCCNPSDDASAFLSYDLINACQFAPDFDWSYTAETVPYPELYIGVDIGRNHDLTVIYVLARVAGLLITVAIITLQNKTFAEQESELYAWLELPEVKRICIDSTGLGKQFAERAQQKRRWGVEAVDFTAPVKSDLAYPLRCAFEDRNVRIPDIEDLRADLRAIKKETTPSGNIRFAADRGKNGHADRFWALALALHAAQVNPTPGHIHVFNSGRHARINQARRERSLA